ncbi:FkbM family methyltransferase [Burkholderia sp. FL-7-2-10-S1-D7]|uniref:FkbM family methyltransferase n=1 Tax=Burkholderia sp. FL-7-2-10-S1-D7 TaxID=1637866 RepID=UPI000B31031A|nr:FkbM family methyltransferase [Burkholderia sp. FL-7-2-10-S1-D7]
MLTRRRRPADDDAAGRRRATPAGFAPLFPHPFPAPFSCTLDTLNFPKSPALIKIDVEGLELDVLKGGTAFLERHGFPPLLLEAWNLEWFSEKRAALLDYLKTLGYTWFAMGDELVAQHPSFARQVSFETGADGVIRMNRTR